MRVWMLGLLILGACRYSSDVGGPDADGDLYGEQVDCNDDDPSVHPGATEEPYNGIDDDCDPSTPDEDVDADGYTVAQGDCDDTDPTRHPGAEELCNGVDDDCDPETDEDAGDLTWYVDADGDGYGDEDTATTVCSPGEDLVARGGDCDETSADAAEIHPGATEQCDDIDWNCDDQEWQGVPAGEEGVSTYYLDADGDGWGVADTSVTACEDHAPEGYDPDPGDCNDDPDEGGAIHPGAEELCNDVDDDCDGETDEGATDRSTFYLDQDGDGYGVDADAHGIDPGGAVEVLACGQPEGYAAEATDCDDLDANTHPGADEVCDGVVNDCDAPGSAVADAGAVDAIGWFPDADGDGWGDADSHPTTACDPPGEDWVIADLATDCNDDDTPDGEGGTIGAAAHPGATEVCDDGLDNDCDGTVDNAFDATLWFVDADGDGHGSPASSQWACDRPAGHAASADDCNDDPAAGGADVNPGETEICNGATPVDDDCNGRIDDIAQDDRATTGATQWYQDPDGDGWAASGAATWDACAQPDGYVAGTQLGDCDETDDAVHPTAPLQCGNVDADCDGQVDHDDDRDGFAGVEDCPGTTGGDCDDGDGGGDLGDPLIYPGSAEICPGGLTCLDVFETWGFTTDQAYWIEDPDDPAGAIQVLCDMGDSMGGPGPGWTRVYFEDFSSGDGGWTYDPDPFASGDETTSSTLDCGGSGTDLVLGDEEGGELERSVHLNPVASSTASVPHEDVHVRLDYYAINGWDHSSDTAYLNLDDQRLWWDSPSGGSEDLCGNGSKTDPVIALGETIWLPDDDAVFIEAGAEDLETNDNEGFAIDDVEVWVR